MRLLEDGTRRKIILFLRARESTVREIAMKLHLTPQTIYHHIKKLRKAGIVHVSREKRRGNLIESYYQAIDEEVEG